MQPESSGETQAHAIVRGLQVLGMPGVLFVSWTVIFCIAILKGDGAFLAEHWWTLYFTWFAMVGVWVFWLVRLSRKIEPADEGKPAGTFEAIEEAKPEPPAQTG